MVASSDSKPRREIVYNTPYCGLPMQRRPESSDAANEGDANDQVHVKPIDMLIPVG